MTQSRCKAIICLLLGAALLAGCAPKKDDTGNISDKKKVVVWAWDDTFNVKAAKSAALEYESKNSNVEITVVTKEREEILEDVKNMLSAKLYNKLPDVMMMEDYDVQEMLSLYPDEFVELTDQIPQDKFVDYKRQLCSKDGKLYGIPFDSGTAALFYRLDILEKAGYTEADMQNLTWDRYMEIGEDVYKKTGIPMLTLDPTDLPLLRLMMQSNGDWYVGKDGTTVTIAGNESLKEALEIYEKLLKENIGISVNGWNEFISAFQNGRVATVLSGGWIISSIKESKSQSGEWRVAPIPVMADNPSAVAASNVGGSAWYVLRHTKNSEAAKRFVVSMFGDNDPFLDQLIGEIGIIPAVKDPSGFVNYEAEDPFFGGQKVTKLLTGLEREIPVVNYGSRTYELEDIIEEEFQKMLLSGDLDQCLAEAQMKGEAVARE